VFDEHSLIPELYVAVLDGQRCKVAAAIFPLGAVEENCVLECVKQGVTKRCRLSWLTSSALVYETTCRGRGWGRSGVSANEYTGAQINFRDLTPYLTYGGELCD
jgi:hypothetical protein